MSKLQSIAAVATIIGVIIAAIALIPAFGQWLSPNPSIPTSYKEIPSATISEPDIKGASSETTTAPPSLTPIRISTPLPMAQPQPTRVIERGDTYSIVLRSPTSDEKSGGLRIKMLVGGQSWTRTFMIRKAVPDVSGGWAVGDFTGYFYENDYANTAPVQFDQGMYALVGHSAGSDLIIGLWGNQHREQILGSSQSIDSYLVFPIEKGMVTEIVLNFAFLEIGVIQNGQAAEGVLVNIFCPKADVANNQILYDCQAGDATMATNAGGLATFVIAPGKYSAELYKFQYIDNYRKALEITSFEKSRLVINVP